MRKRYNRITGLALGAMLCLTACGSQPEKVTDYGGSSAGKTEVASAVPGGEDNTGSKSEAASEGNGGAGTESDTGSGSESGNTESGAAPGKLPPQQRQEDGPYYEDHFTLGSKPADISIDYIWYDTEQLRSYRVSRITEDRVHETEMVKNLFGDTAKELKGTVSDENGDSPDVVAECRSFYNDWNTKQEVMFETGPVQAWGDETDRFWHTYEGKMDGVDYQLFIGYRKNEKMKYICLWPRNSADLAGDPEMTSLMSFSENIYFDDGEHEDLNQILQQPNRSVKSEEELCGLADQFTKEKLCARLPREDLAVSKTNYYSEDGNEVTEQKVQLLFSTPLYEDDMATLPGVTADGSAIHFVQSKRSSIPLRGFVDGYQIDCNWTHSGNAGFQDEVDGAGNNTGVLYVTDHGVIGADLIISYEILDELSGDAEILPFEKLMTCLREELLEHFDSSRINGTSLKIGDASLAFLPVESPDNPDEAIFVPAWRFWCESNGGVAVISLNAMDGSLIDIRYVR